MIIFGIEDFVKELKKINGNAVEINIKHKLYGDQKIKYGLCVLEDEGRIGFSINDQDIYLNKRDILNYGIEKGMYFWADKLMTIEIYTT